MGYLDNSTVTVDAILTKKGREILSKGQPLNISKFALSDDEIDYDLWNPAHTLGTNYYGAVIENMPLLEALPDENQMMRYKLLTLPKDASGIPQLVVNPTVITFSNLTAEVEVTPSISAVGTFAPNTSTGYTAILSDDRVATITVSQASTSTTTAPEFLSDSTMRSGMGSTVTVVGMKFKIKPVGTLRSRSTALLTIIGNDLGGFKTIPITVDPSNFGSESLYGSSSPMLDI